MYVVIYHWYTISYDNIIKLFPYIDFTDDTPATK